jgi:hypothetical protein
MAVNSNLYYAFMEEGLWRLPDNCFIKLMDDHMKLIDKIQEAAFANYVTPSPEVVKIYKELVETLGDINIRTSCEDSLFYDHTENLDYETTREFVNDYISDILFFINILECRVDDIDLEHYADKYLKIKDLLKKVIKLDEEDLEMYE